MINLLLLLLLFMAGWKMIKNLSIIEVLEESINYIDIKNNYNDFLSDSSIDEIQINRDNFFENKKSKNFF